MILTDREIKNSIAAGLIGVSPRPTADAFSSTALDLTLAPSIRVFKKAPAGQEIIIDPLADGYSVMEILRNLTEDKEIDKDTGYVLAGRELILAWTTEKISLHEHGRVGARVEGKSSLARLGLAVHVTAPTIHSGFDAIIQLEMINHGPNPIRLRRGMPVCQIIFEQTLGMPEKAYQGQFQGQKS